MHIEHAALYTADLEKTKSFFCRYFGATCENLYHNTTTGFRSYFLTFDDGARLEIMTRPEITAQNMAIATRNTTVLDNFTGASADIEAFSDIESNGYRIGYSHLAFSVGSRSEVDRITNMLRADGYKIISGPRTTGDGYYESCFRDDSGNQIEITE